MAELEEVKTQTDSLVMELIRDKEKLIVRLWGTIILLILLLVGSWVIMLNGYEKTVTETTTQTVTQDTEGEGINNFVGGDNYGETDSNDNDSQNNHS